MSVSDQFRADCGVNNYDISSYKGPRFVNEIQSPEDTDLYIKFLQEAPTELIFPKSRLFRIWRRFKFALKI